MDDGLNYLLAAALSVAIFVAIIAVAVSTAPRSHRVTDVLRVNVTANATLPPLARVRLQTQAFVNLAEKKAKALWHGTRCASGIAYRYQSLVASRIAEANWSYYPSSPTTYFGCSITFNNDPRKIRISFYLYCAAVVHEFGHLHGFYEKGGPNNGTHSSDPANVMYPTLTRRNIPATCKRR